MGHEHRSRAEPGTFGTVGIARVQQNGANTVCICQDHEDCYGESGLCPECGQLICGECNTTIALKTDITACPMCRTSYLMSNKVKAQKLRALLTRLPGRHTTVAHC